MGRPPLAAPALNPHARQMKTSNLIPTLAVFCVALTSACASGGGGASADELAAGSVEMRLWNRSDRSMTVYARWGNAPRQRLGQLSGSRRATFTSAVRGPNVAISWDVVGSPPSPTAGAGAAFPRVADGNGSPQCLVDVAAGDRIEWTIDNTGNRCTFVRLDPVF
jgi:hypothetical protein